MTNHDPLTAPVLTFDQIARITGISKEAVKKAHDRGLAKFRAAWEKEFTDRKQRDELAQIDEG